MQSAGSMTMKPLPAKASPLTTIAASRASEANLRIKLSMASKLQQQGLVRAGSFHPPCRSYYSCRSASAGRRWRD